MNLGKLSKRLRKELLANPKQAAVLAIACLVACWFWSPLLMKWFKGKAKVQAAKVEPVAAIESVAKAEPKHSWFDIQRWRLSDPLTRSVALVDVEANPFRTPSAAIATQADEPNPDEQTERTTASPLQSERVGLTLEAILYSPSRRLAQINGQTVRENEVFEIGKTPEPDADGASTASQLKGRVTTIQPNEVSVEVGGQLLRLSLPSKRLGQGEVVKRLPRP